MFRSLFDIKTNIAIYNEKKAFRERCKYRAKLKADAVEMLLG